MTATANMVRDTGFRDRLFRAWYLYQARTGGGKPQEWLAEAVSLELGLEESLTQGAVSRWLGGAVPRDLRTIVAIAKVLGVDPGWLAFGEDSQAPPPSDPMKDGMRRLLEPEG